MKLFIIFTLFSVAQYASALVCKEENFYSRFGEKRQLSFEEIEGGYEYVDNISHMELKTDKYNLYVDKSLSLYNVNNSAKELVVQLKEAPGRLSEDVNIKLFEYEGVVFLEVGKNDYMEGHFSSVYAIDLKTKKILNSINLCANQEHLLGINNGDLIYKCDWVCEKEKSYLKFDLKSKVFTKVQGNCSINKNDKKIEAYKEFILHRTKDKNGKEYTRSKFKLTAANCLK